MLATINIVYINNDGKINYIHSFPDTDEGKQAVEDYFTKIMKKHEPDIDQSDIEDAIEDGSYFIGNGDMVYVNSSKVA
jgi:predicted SnoaL-like aldol condensation-catalyzing enzyme